ncbi:hypothetical protein BW730_13645 [Tessaracoccus aquimaris]|uniref:ScyD/ScyE family protein n=1 Tax=Tessaracoccus aquimaris TaxID=1332264 RepID=A0A1Q2CQK5_9ACTN|nr:ScyD/ScyE family protein [Tessaracoccus aquimaris]AQP48391.1 hypothetical protein BW730_13645 [Tessaracoccus aquimaris]
MRRIRALFAAGAAAALIVGAPAPASASPREPVTKVWSSQVAVPFSLAVDGSRVLVADGGPGIIGQLQSNGSIKPLLTGIPGLAGLATRGAWTAYGSSIEDDSEPPIISASGLNIRSPKGTTVYADVHAYETKHNPDGALTYGITDPTSCAAGFTAPGRIDSHVYGVASWRGDWLVADAGANAIFRVTDRGAIRTLAVLPPVPVTLTAESVGALGLGDCAIGDTFYAEAVPTGVAVGRGGDIYVSTLPGFPGESASLGAVWRINPSNGKATMVASGLSGATGLAVSGSKIYVAQLFGPGIALVDHGKVSTFAPLAGSLSVATAPNGTVWASTMDLSGQKPGTIVSISNKRVTVRGHFR